MKLKRAIDIQGELIRNVIDLYSCGRMFHYTSAEFNQKFQALFDRYPKDLPGHVRDYVRGYRNALDDERVHKVR